jgi:hypothetical protein
MAACTKREWVPLSYNLSTGMSTQLAAMSDAAESCPTLDV